MSTILDRLLNKDPIAAQSTKWNGTVLTVEEHDYVLDNMRELLHEYGFNWTKPALEKVITVFAQNKGWMIEAFRQHPNYVKGKLCIAFSQDFPRKIEMSQARRILNWLKDPRVVDQLIQRMSEEQFKTWVVNNENYPASDYRYYQVLKKYSDPFNPDGYYNNMWIALIDDARSAIENISRITTKELTQDDADYLTRVITRHDSTVKFSKGMKTSRAINKMLCAIGYDKVNIAYTDREDTRNTYKFGYNAVFAKYSDAMSPIDIKRHTVISLNPLDYFTMSFGNSWASCHTIDKYNHRGRGDHYHGMYCAGTMSYMLDKTSIVTYTVDGKYEGTDFWAEDKITRQMFHYQDNGKLIQGRLYPQSNDGEQDVYEPYRNMMQQLISTLFHFENRWILKRGTSNVAEWTKTYGNNYTDYEHYDSVTISFVRDYEGEDKNEVIQIGHPMICIQCGRESEGIESNISCCGDPKSDKNSGEELPSYRFTRPAYEHEGIYDGSRRRISTVRCRNCRDTIDEEMAVEIDGDYYCHDCVSYCEYCEEYHMREHFEYTIYNANGTSREVCWDEFEESGAGCEACDEIFENDQVHEITVAAWNWRCDSNGHVVRTNARTYEQCTCENCIEDLCRCSRCGNYADDSDFDFENDLCPMCVEEDENEAEAMIDAATAPENQPAILTIDEDFEIEF